MMTEVLLAGLFVCVHGRTVSRQTPLSMESPRKEYWRGLPFPPSGDLANPGIKPPFPASPELQVDSLLLCHLGSLS